MSNKLIAIVLLCGVYVIRGQAQDVNFLIKAQNTALGVKAGAIYWTTYHRQALSSEASYIGTNYLKYATEYLAEHDLAANGVRVQHCIGVYNSKAWALVMRANDMLAGILSASNSLHQSVIHQLTRTNVMRTDWNTFYDGHTVYINQVQNQLESQIKSVADHMLLVWMESVYIVSDFNDCLHEDTV